VKRVPNNNLLGAREVTNGVAGKYIWQTYQQVYETVILIGSAMRHIGVEPKGRCGIYGANCPEWFIAMEACNAHSIVCVPLYDTLGAEAVEFIVNHAEVSIAFAQGTKLPLMIASLPKCTDHLKTIVSFTSVTSDQKTAAEAAGVVLYSWEEFLQLVCCHWHV
jgi:long-chain acyl-CoA synthetase